MPKKKKYQQVSTIDDSDDAFRGGSLEIEPLTNTENNYNNKNKKKDENLNNPITSAKKIRSCGDLFHWFRKDPISRLPFCYFILIIPVCIVLVLFFWANWPNGGSTEYIALGSTGIVSSIWGFRQFRLLMNLMDGVDELQKLNKKFKKENILMTNEVDRLIITSKELKNAAKKLSNNVYNLKKNVSNLNEINNTLDTCNIENKDKIEELIDYARKVSDKWKNELVQNERATLMRIFDKYAKENPGFKMTKNQYNKFIGKLPEKYQLRMIKLNIFDKNKESVTQDEFHEALEIILEIEAHKDRVKKNINMQQYQRRFDALKKSKVSKRLLDE